MGEHDEGSVRKRIIEAIEDAVVSRKRYIVWSRDLSEAFADRILALKAEAAPAAEQYDCDGCIVASVAPDDAAFVLCDECNQKRRTDPTWRPKADLPDGHGGGAPAAEPVAWLLEYEIVGTGWVRAHRPGLGSSLWPDEKQVRDEAAKYAKDYFVRLVPLHSGGFVPWRSSTTSAESEEGA